jgi:hypothetical protein
VQSVESLLSGPTSNQLWKAWNLQQRQNVYHETRKAESCFTSYIDRTTKEIIHINRRLCEKKKEKATKLSAQCKRSSRDVMPPRNIVMSSAQRILHVVLSDLHVKILHFTHSHFSR